MNNKKERIGEVVNTVAQRLVQNNRHEAAAELLQGIDDIQGAIKYAVACWLAFCLWCRFSLVTAITQCHSCILKQPLQRQRWAHAVQLLLSKLPTQQAVPPVAVRDLPHARANAELMAFWRCRHLYAECTPPDISIQHTH